MKSNGKVGYVPCNELADKLLQDCITLPMDKVAPLPWSPGRGLGETGRVNAILAIRDGNFGVARKGEGERAKYKFYYRRHLAGRSYAEIWGLWKTAFIAAPMVMSAMYLGPFLLKWTRHGASYPGHHLAAFLLGLLMIAVFLPRAILSFGNQFESSTTTGKSFVEAGAVIALPMALCGVNFAFFGLFMEWSVSEMWDLLVDRVFYPRGEEGGLILVAVFVEHWLVQSAFRALLVVAVSLFFWHVSFRWLAAGAMAGRMKALPEGIREKISTATNSFHHIVLSGSGRGQIVLAMVPYAMVLAVANATLLSWIVN